MLTDREFEIQFSKNTLNPELFSHEAHIRLAWIHISKYGVTQAIENIRSQLHSYVTHLGAVEKYNETLTVAAIKAVKHFMQKYPFDNFQDFIIAFPRLKTHFKDIIEQHYSFDIFTSQNAKEKYLEPDIVEFT